VVLCKLTRNTSREVLRVADNGYLTSWSASLTPEERSEHARKAGLASAAKRYQHRLQKDILKDILSLECDDKEAVNALKALGLDESFANAANLAVLRRAVKGDVESLRYIRDTIGEKPRDGLEIGNLDGKPLATIDMSTMTDDELRALIASRRDAEEA
jgi:hypothetical protein